MTIVYHWSPLAESIENANITKFMKKHGQPNLSALYQKSINDLDWFWRAVVEDLPIDFFEPFDQVLDDSRGIAWSQWFLGGKINIAHNCLDRHAQGSRSHKTAVIWEGEDHTTRKWNYSDLNRATDQFAANFVQLGIHKGDRVGLFLPMLPETVAAFLAIAKIGAICIPIFSGFAATAVATRLQDGEAKLLITADGFYRKGKTIDMNKVAEEAAAQCETVQTIVVVSRLESSPEGVLDMKVHTRDGQQFSEHREWTKEPKEISCEQMDSEDPFMIIYTSGTTGRPKGAVHVHGGFLVKVAQEVHHQTDLQENDILYWFSDIGWIMGPWEIVGGLALGGTVFLYEGAPDYPGPDRLWEMIDRHNISILGISPTLIRALMTHGTAPLEKHDLSSLRILGSTGEPWNPDPWKWFFENVGSGRCPIINLSGGTEVGACFLSPTPITPLKPCTVGAPSLGMAIDIYDTDGTQVAGANRLGELVCTKPWPGMTRGVWKDSDRYEETYWSRWPNVWVHGDWAVKDEDGLWFLHGRSDDTISIAGKRLGPAEVESALAAHEAVAESAAIGVPHELKGESIWCFVVLNPGVERTEEMRAALTGQVIAILGKSFAPSQIRFVSELPRTRNAKILRRAVRATALGIDPGDLSNLENPSALDEIRYAE